MIQAIGHPDRTSGCGETPSHGGSAAYEPVERISLSAPPGQTLIYLALFVLQRISLCWHDPKPSFKPSGTPIGSVGAEKHPPTGVQRLKGRWIS
ncbi:unnamed protein product [Ectocarpus sp. CCAP 1310/34]|nr:unnamed protein product [Ectocarpus sp. CCAP 1310/34]